MSEVFFRAGDLVIWGDAPAEVVEERGRAVRLKMAGGGDAVVPVTALVAANQPDPRARLNRTSLLTGVADLKAAAAELDAAGKALVEAITREPPK